MSLTVTPASTRVMNLGHLLDQAADRKPSEAAIICGEKSWTWDDFRKRTDAMCRALAAHGIAKGDRVLVQARNSHRMFEAMFAVFKLGAVLVPVNFRLAPADVGYIAQASGSDALIYDPPFAEHADAVKQERPDINLVVAMEEPRAGEEDWDSLIRRHAGAAYRATDVDRDDPCWFFFTSGTTGHPKAAVLTHGQMAFVVTNHIADLMPGLGYNCEQGPDASLVVAPLSHGAGIHMLMQIARAVPSVLPEQDRLDPNEVFQLIERHRITNMFTVPSIVKRLVEHPAVDEHDHTSLRHVIYAGAPMYREDQKVALQKLGPCLVQYFGLGEVTGNITVLPVDDHDLDDNRHRLGTCGYARTGMQVSVQDEQGQEVARGDTGELCIAGPAVFAGYYNNEGANAAAFRNGWFRTGDLGHMDQAGYVYITGRASDMYISGGSNVYPKETEEKLLTHPAIRDVAIVGMEDREWGEVGVAAVVFHEGKSVAPEDLFVWMEGKVARYKQPRQFFVFGELPVSGYGKVTKKLVRAAIEKRMADKT